MSPKGKHRTRLTKGPADDAFPNYSPDGERIVFTRGVAGSTGVGQAWIMNQDGSGKKQLTHGSPTVESTTFSPNGKRIAFTRGDGGSPQLWTMKVDGTDQTQLTFPGPDGDHVHGPTYSPGGRLIAFSHHYGAVGYHGISVIKPNGTGEKALTMPSAATDDFQPDFSPDGKRIVFDRYNQLHDDLYVMNANGSGQRALTNTSDLDLSPAFSPNGAKVAFERDNTDFTVANVVLVDSSGLNQNITPLTTNAVPVQDFEPGWQPLNPPSCKVSGDVTSRSVKRVTVTVKCTNENATVTVKGSGKAPKAAHAAKAKRFNIPAVTVKVPAGAHRSIKLKVPKKGQKALRRAAEAGKTGRAKITATSRDDLGQASEDSLKVKFKVKKTQLFEPRAQG
jgi:Tol biopolymer transport system component